jgi:hypothetical protein
MEFLITSYIYPLKEPLVLSPHLGFNLDNPRTELEVTVVKDYLLRAYESGYDYKLPIHSDEPIVTIEGILEDFRNVLSADDPVVAETFMRYNRDHIFNFLASIWVVVRFEDEGLGETLRQSIARCAAKAFAGSSCWKIITFWSSGLKISQITVFFFPCYVIQRMSRTLDAHSCPILILLTRVNPLRRYGRNLCYSG